MRMQEVDLNREKNITFRFRSTDKVIKYNELKDSYLYFCPYSEEDDVLEGMSNLYWQADEILWKNFYAHYLLVLFFNHTRLLFASDDDEKENIVHEGITWRLFRTDFRIENMISSFLEHDVTNIVLEATMSKNHKVHRDELKFYFHLLHLVALQTIKKNCFPDNADFVKKDNLLDLPKDSLKKFLDAVKWDDMNKDSVFRVFDKKLRCYLGEILSSNEKRPSWETWIIHDFPDIYFQLLNKVAFPDWYLTSFCKNCTNARNWAQYGDSHKGICLIFRTHDSRYGKGIRLNICHKYDSRDGYVYEKHIEPLKEISYLTTAQELNFFSYLGNIPVGILKEWCTMPDGTISQYYVSRNSREKWDMWHRNYWETFQNIALQKGSSWIGLAEERIILTDDLIVDYHKKENRKIHYDFSELQGIIWGCRTDDAQKKIIRDIITNLCKEHNRSGFEFYQAVEEPGTLDIWIEKDI